MPNPSGKNTPSSFDDFTQGTPYGEKAQAAALQKSAPVAGDSSLFLGTPRRATEIAVKNAQDRARQQAKTQASGEPLIPTAPEPQAAPDPFAEAWQAAASMPGASSLVKEYALRAS